MKLPSTDSIDHFKKVLSLALDIDDAFNEASHVQCTCGSDPEGYCPFCSRWEKAEKKMAEFKKLVERGLGYD